MKRVIIYSCILILLLFSPVTKLDVADLEPVEVVYLYKESGNTVLQTDTDAKGKGEDVLAALDDLRQTTSGVVYLDTARYLLIAPDALEQAEALRRELKGKIRVCMAADVPLDEAAAYLHTHGKLPTLGSWKQGQPLPFWNGEKIFKKP